MCSGAFFNTLALEEARVGPSRGRIGAGNALSPCASQQGAWPRPPGALCVVSESASAARRGLGLGFGHPLHVDEQVAQRAKEIAKALDAGLDAL